MLSLQNIEQVAECNRKGNYNGSRNPLGPPTDLPFFFFSFSRPNPTNSWDRQPIKHWSIGR